MIFIKKLFLVIIFLVPIYISSFKYKETTFFEYQNISSNKNVIVHLKDKDLYLDLEDYVIGVIGAEMPASFSKEALKAQAVASRSFAMSKEENNLIEISSTVSDQVYYTNDELIKKWGSDYKKYYNKLLEAAYSTKGEVVTRDGNILRTYYFSMSNGKTENSMNVFNVSTFLSVDSPYENSSLKNFEVEKEFSKEELLKILNLSEIIIQNVTINDTGHVDNIVITNKKFKGTEFRKLLNLRSTDFEIKESGDVFLIKTRGYGHGVGMSQYGANEMAKKGYDYREIINHYYQNSEMTKI